ncbi:hypothetical protein ABT023_03480 [Micromonospora sp. NPDC002296]|uniref:hypothetical protein n=1 Tax=Micromonospora sp. NPDC002296 TaxID=3154271 RepID=UPI0033219691
MTRDFAALLAQVVPVFAIALALEIRALGPRLVEISKQERAERGGRERWLDEPVSKASLFEMAYVIAWTNMPALGALEMKALYVAGEASKDVPFGAIFIGIGIVCTIPLVQGALYFAEARDARGKSWKETTFWRKAFILLIIFAGLTTVSVFV